MGLILYAAGTRAAAEITGTSFSGAYNGIRDVGRYDGVRQILRLIAESGKQVFKYLFYPTTAHSRAMGALNYLLGFAAVGALGYLALRGKWGTKGARPLLFVLLVLMPLGMNCIYVISKGMEHELMIFSFFLSYVFALWIFQLLFSEKGWYGKVPALGKWLRRGVCAALGALIFNSVVFANQAYLKKHMEYQSTMSIMTRVTDRMEQTEGYVPGETPVALVGSLDFSPLVRVRTDMGQIYSSTGNSSLTALTYYETYGWYFQDVLAYPVNLVDGKTASDVGKKEEVQAMSAFPAADSCQMVDGVLVVKLS